MSKKRKCKVCGKTLADLNPNDDLCFAHDPKYPQYEYVPVTKCTGAGSIREFGVQSDDPHSMPSETYNELAFTRVLIYPNLEEDENDRTRN